jgi:AAA15 family ATPase/GTPase
MARKTNPISKIAVRNFKSIWDEQQIELKPLTLLAGANSSGKSSIMQPILLLKQTIEAPGDPGALLLDGPNVRFTKADQLLSQLCKRDAKKEFYIRVELSEDGIIELLFHKEKDIGFDII